MRNPLKTSTYGTGQLIADALSKGCRRFIMGIGGSATNDAGTGMFEALDEGMQAFSKLIYQKTGTDVMNIKGAGAAGGLGGALKAFLNADLIITGEGRIDSQTLTGKLPYAVALRASSGNIPVIAVCGRTEVESLPCFARICPVTPPEMPLSEAMKVTNAQANIRSAVAGCLNFLQRNSEIC